MLCNFDSYLVIGALAKTGSGVINSPRGGSLDPIEGTGHLNFIFTSNPCVQLQTFVNFQAIIVKVVCHDNFRSCSYE